MTIMLTVGAESIRFTVSRKMAFRTRHTSTLLASTVLLAVAAPSSGSAQSSPAPLSIRLHDNERVVLSLSSLEVRCREQVPATCGLAADSDLAVLHYVVRNHGQRAYTGRIDLFTLLGAPATRDGQPEFWEQMHPEPGACGPIPSPRYPIETGFDPPLSAGRARRFHALFEIPRKESVARLLYHDDDFPRCLSAPRVIYSGAVCRPKRRPPADVPCHFFER